MNNARHGRHLHGPHHGGIEPAHRPYWKRAHRDWRLWVGVILMLAAMMIYLGTFDLAWRPRFRAEQRPAPSDAK